MDGQITYDFKVEEWFVVQGRTIAIVDLENVPKSIASRYKIGSIIILDSMPYRIKGIEMHNGPNQYLQPLLVERIENESFS